MAHGADDDHLVTALYPGVVVVWRRFDVRAGRESDCWLGHGDGRGEGVGRHPVCCCEFGYLGKFCLQNRRDGARCEELGVDGREDGCGRQGEANRAAGEKRRRGRGRQRGSQPCQMFWTWCGLPDGRIVERGGLRGERAGVEGGSRCFERCARALFDSGAARVYEASEHHVLARLKFK